MVIFIIGDQSTGSGNYIMEKIVITDKRTIGMYGAALFIAILKQAKIHETFIGEHMK